MDYYAVIGNPISHSLSPFIHHAFAKQTQQQLKYEAIQVVPEALFKMLSWLKEKKVRGINITLPLKRQAFQWVDKATQRARHAQAINMIKFLESGRSIGDNTDGVGFIRDLDRQFGFSLKNKKVLLLGAGGAAHGILPAILNEFPHGVTIWNRTESRARELVNQFSLQWSHAIDLRVDSNQSVQASHFDILINATSAGIKKEHLMLPAHLINPDVFCYDLSYGDAASPFLECAKKAHARACSDGLGMLVEQAAESFREWRGIQPDIQPVLEQLRKKLKI